MAWDEVEGNNVYYQVRWKESASDGGWRARWTRLYWHLIRKLTPGTEYTVQVRSYDRGGAGYGKWSSATMTTTVGGTTLNQRAGVTVSAADPVPVDEGGEASYTVVLDGQPTGDVVIAVTSDNADITTQPARLTFTAGNWYTPRTVTVSAGQDGDAADDAATRFDGREGELSLDGDVASAMLGADFRRDRATVGLALAHSSGDGSYSGAGSGKVESTLTGLYPYGRYEASERLSLWGIAGYGAGTLALTPEGGTAVETDTDMTMGAVGARGVAVEAPAEGGLELAVRSDALLLRISSDSARDGDGGRLAAADADVNRLRLCLEGAWRGIETEGGGSLTPTLEVGLRHDGGDAETGLGVGAGAGIAWSDPASGIAAELKARGLLAHEADGFRERGLSGAFGWDPTPGSDRGPSLSLTRTMGASASGGVDALFANGAPAGLAANGDDGLDVRRFEAKFGYGFSAFGDRFTLTPELGFGLSNDSRDYGLGWRLNLSGGDRSSFELRLDATRRDAANDNGAGSEPEHTFGVRLNARW